MEIPVFQTKEQFEAIISKSESPDQIILDLDTPEGRNEIAKRYEPLVHKMAKQFMGKSNLSYEELLSAAYQGLTWAMNGYGKKTKKNNADMETIVSKTFTQYAAWIIRVAILEDIKHLSQTVRVPLSQQNLEREQTGRNTKNNTISGDKEIGNGKDDTNKSLFDYVGSTDNATRSIDNEDVDKLWKAFFKQLESEFDKTIIDIYYSSLGLNGYEKIKKKELAQKFGIAQSSITYYLYKVNNYIQTNKKMKAMITDIFELMSECKHDEDMDYDPEEGIYIEIKNNRE
jgi:RNA polymerase sigma factor (sigma-70 family)